MAKAKRSPDFLQGMYTPPADRQARFGVLPLPYEGTVSWNTGTVDGPSALLEASTQVETYDEVLDDEPCRHGIVTYPAPDFRKLDPGQAVALAEKSVEVVLEAEHTPVVLGGEHSLSGGVYRALAARFGEIGVIQLDAHADLRDELTGTPYSHGCVMRRIREQNPHVLQLGIRSLSREEIDKVRSEQWDVRFMHRLRASGFAFDDGLAKLPDQVFLTVDIDALDLGLVRSTGTPDPGGFTWTEVDAVLERITQRKTVVGFDVVELSGGDPASAFAAARLTYRLMGRVARGPGLRV